MALPDAGAPLTIRDVRTELLSVRLTRSVLAAIDRVATKFAISRSELVRIWISAADETSSEPPPLQSLSEALADFERDFPL